MISYKATIRHNSIASARVVDLGTTDMTIAKRRSAAEFGGEDGDYTIVILGDETPDNPSGIVARRRAAGRKWQTLGQWGMWS